ncbi:MAG: glycosyltransferase family 39 protein [Chloroflexi bacterium]|nr:glycosyltransferase family 39 protein [Chloroflexota bacterium]
MMDETFSRVRNIGSPALLATLLLAVAAARILFIADVHLHGDELWSIWQGMGGFVDTIRWTPYDWPPLYFILLDVWSEIVGLEALGLRYLSVLFYMIGSAFLYLAIKKEANRNAAFLVVLFLGGFAFVKFLSTELRGYSVMLMTLPMVWFFSNEVYRRPKRWNVLGLSLSTVVSIYATYVTALPIALLMSYGLWKQPRRSLHSLRFHFYSVILSMILVVPLFISLFPLIFSRTGAIDQLGPQLFFHDLLEILQLWLGPGFYLVCILGCFSLISIFWKRRLNKLELFGLSWGILSLPLMYSLNFVFGFFAQKYMSWILIGIAVFLGLMIGRLPWKIQLVPVICSIVLLTQSFPWLEEYSKWFAFRLDENLKWLEEEMYAGDAILFAQDHECLSLYQDFELNLHLHLRFPSGINLVDSIAGEQRIWFVTADGSPDSPHWETLRRDYVERHFVGPPGCLFRLYERPPDAEGVLFSNGMRFHGAQFLQDGQALPPGFIPQLHEGEGFQVRLWWKVEERLPQDHSVGTFLFDAAGRVIEEVHGPPDPSYPEGAPWETSRWQVGQLYYEDRDFELPYPLERQRLDLRLAVYYWENPSQRFTAEGIDALGMLPNFHIQIKSW